MISIIRLFRGVITKNFNLPPLIEIGTRVNASENLGKTTALPGIPLITPLLLVIMSLNDTVGSCTWMSKNTKIRKTIGAYLFGQGFFKLFHVKILAQILQFFG
jgi:hypothetical protein